MIGPETELPVSKQEVLNVSPNIILSRIVAQLAGMIRNLKNQSDDLPFVSANRN